GTLYSRRASKSSPLVRLEEWKIWEALTTPGEFSSKWEWKLIKSYCHLYGTQTKANDRRTILLLP
ncbi:hypothetical protein TNCV_4852441, partial [Trichonephila clavipes]